MVYPIVDYEIGLLKFSRLGTHASHCFRFCNRMVVSYLYRDIVNVKLVINTILIFSRPFVNTQVSQGM